MTTLALLRHGHTDWNRAGRIQGRTDVPLDDAARVYLAGLRLPGRFAQAVLHASPLTRARDTAQLVAGRAPEIHPALTEMDWGAWEGLHGRDLAADPASGFRHIEDWGWDYRPPGGESPREMRDRITPWQDGLRQDTVAVCHIGVMRVILAMATGWAFSGPSPFKIKRDRLLLLEQAGGAWHLQGTPLRLESRTA